MKELLKILANRYYNDENEKNFVKMFIYAYEFAETDEKKSQKIIRKVIRKLSRKKENKIWCFLSHANSFIQLPISDFDLRYEFKIWICKENPKLIFLERWLCYEDLSIYFIVETNENIIEAIKKALIKEKLKMVAN